MSDADGRTREGDAEGEKGTSHCVICDGEHDGPECCRFCEGIGKEPDVERGEEPNGQYRPCSFCNGSGVKADLPGPPTPPRLAGWKRWALGDTSVPPDERQRPADEHTLEEALTRTDEYANRIRRLTVENAQLRNRLAAAEGDAFNWRVRCDAAVALAQEQAQRAEAAEADLAVERERTARWEFRANDVEDAYEDTEHELEDAIQRAEQAEARAGAYRAALEYISNTASEDFEGRVARKAAQDALETVSAAPIPRDPNKVLPTTEEVAGSVDLTGGRTLQEHMDWLRGRDTEGALAHPYDLLSAETQAFVRRELEEIAKTQREAAANTAQTGLP